LFWAVNCKIIRLHELSKVPTGQNEWTQLLNLNQKQRTNLQTYLLGHKKNRKRPQK